MNALSHYTDWTLATCTPGRLGWVAFVSIGAIYYLIPRLVGRKRCSTKPSKSTSGSPRSPSCSTSHRCGLPGVMQGLMWRAVNRRHADLQFCRESGEISYRSGSIRFLGGAFYLGSMFIMAYNVYMTVRARCQVSAVPPPACGTAGSLRNRENNNGNYMTPSNARRLC